MSVIEIAHAWLEQTEYAGRKGFVVLYDGEVSGWMSKLHNSRSYRPGCIAVSEAGESWTAIGGNYEAGALMWLSNNLF